MKKNNLFYFLSFAIIMFISSSCGTISNALSKENKDLRLVYLMNCPSDATINFDGKDYPVITADYIKYQVVTSSKVSMPAVYLPFKKGGKLTITSGGKSASIDMKAGLWAPSTCLNCIFALGVGHAIDYATKNDRVLKPRVIDVEAFLKGEPKNLWQKP
ncbi:MAG: hypothetical protein HYZ42_10930 [Bacteroidetes bacterium]|nr:hypothetical protein [Bacteroidota bacterium]